MKLSNQGLLAATWVVLSTVYIGSVLNHIVRLAFDDGQFVMPMCLGNHILEELPIPVAALIAALFLPSRRIWPRIILGLAAVGLILFICAVLFSTIHFKPYMHCFVLMVFKKSTSIGRRIIVSES